MAGFYIRLGLPLIAQRGLEIGEKFGRHLVSLHRTSDFRTFGRLGEHWARITRARPPLSNFHLKPVAQPDHPRATH
jgi:hypothetical protein